VFQTVTVCAWLAVPMGKLPKESVEGAAVSPGRVPCPLTVASVEDSPELSLITSDPERVPVEVGEKLKLIEHEAPGCNVVRHWSDSEKLLDTVIGLSVNSTVPVFVAVSVCARLVVPTNCAPKITNEGVTARPGRTP